MGHFPGNCPAATSLLLLLKTPRTVKKAKSYTDPFEGTKERSEET